MTRSAKPVGNSARWIGHYLCIDCVCITPIHRQGIPSGLLNPLVSSKKLPGQDRTVVVLESPPNLPIGLIKRLHDPSNTNINRDSAHSSSLLRRAKHARSYIRQDQARVRHIRREPRLLVMKSSHQPVQRRFAGTIWAQRRRKASQRFLTSNAANYRRNCQEDGITALACLK